MLFFVNMICLPRNMGFSLLLMSVAIIATRAVKPAKDTPIQEDRTDYNCLFDRILDRFINSTDDLDSVALPENFATLQYPGETDGDYCVKGPITISKCTLYDMDKMRREEDVIGTEDVYTVTMHGDIQIKPMFMNCNVHFEYKKGKKKLPADWVLYGYSNETAFIHYDMNVVHRMRSIVLNVFRFDKWPLFRFLLKYPQEFEYVGHYVHQNAPRMITDNMDEFLINYLKDKIESIRPPRISRCYSNYRKKLNLKVKPEDDQWDEGTEGSTVPVAEGQRPSSGSSPTTVAPGVPVGIPLDGRPVNNGVPSATVVTTATPNAKPYDDIFAESIASSPVPPATVAKKTTPKADSFDNDSFDVFAENTASSSVPSPTVMTKTPPKADPFDDVLAESKPSSPVPSAPVVTTAVPKRDPFDDVFAENEANSPVPSPTVVTKAPPKADPFDDIFAESKPSSPVQSAPVVTTAVPIDDIFGDSKASSPVPSATVVTKAAPKSDPFDDVFSESKANSPVTSATVVATPAPKADPFAVPVTGNPVKNVAPSVAFSTTTEDFFEAQEKKDGYIYASKAPVTPSRLIDELPVVAAPSGIEPPSNPEAAEASSAGAPPGEIQTTSASLSTESGLDLSPPAPDDDVTPAAAAAGPPKTPITVSSSPVEEDSSDSSPGAPPGDVPDMTLTTASAEVSGEPTSESDLSAPGSALGVQSLVNPESRSPMTKIITGDADAQPAPEKNSRGTIDDLFSARKSFGSKQKTKTEEPVIRTSPSPIPSIEPQTAATVAPVDNKQDSLVEDVLPALPTSAPEASSSPSAPSEATKVAPVVEAPVDQSIDVEDVLPPLPTVAPEAPSTSSDPIDPTEDWFDTETKKEFDKPYKQMPRGGEKTSTTTVDPFTVPSALEIATTVAAIEVASTTQSTPAPVETRIIVPTVAPKVKAEVPIAPVPTSLPVTKQTNAPHAESEPTYPSVQPAPRRAANVEDASLAIAKKAGNSPVVEPKPNVTIPDLLPSPPFTPSPPSAPETTPKPASVTPPEPKSTIPPATPATTKRKPSADCGPGSDDVFSNAYNPACDRELVNVRRRHANRSQKKTYSDRYNEDPEEEEEEEAEDDRW